MRRQGHRRGIDRPLGTELGSKAARAKGPTEVLLPLGGLDKYEAPGGPGRARRATACSLTPSTGPLTAPLPVRELEGNINDPVFSEAAVDTFLRLWGDTNRGA